MSSVPRVAWPGFAAERGQGDDTLLPDAIAHKLIRVLRMQSGEHFVVFDPASAVQAHATLRTVVPPTAALGEATQGLRARRDIRLMQGLAKGDKNEHILQDATELGVSCVHFAEMQRSVVRVPKDKREGRRARWTAIAEAASAQCGRSDVPRVLGPSSLADALKEHLGARILVLYEGGGVPFAEALREALHESAPVVLVVGPEGGLAAEDLAHLELAGCTYCTLGPYVLRTETVAAAALGAALVLASESAFFEDVLIR